MRGGPLAEKRVIQLINRRFVPFYFNVGKGQPGYEAAAHDLIQEVDDRFSGSSVPTPPVWVFTPELELAGTLDNYLPKDRFFTALVRILEEHPEQARWTDAEQAAEGLARAHLEEKLGHYEKARSLYAQHDVPESLLGLVRIARYAGDWDAVADHLEAIADRSAERGDEIAMETAYRLLAAQAYDEIPDLLESAIEEYPESRRLGEMHFYAGVAFFHRDEREWAHYHWCWVLENLRDDHMAMRCYLAATAEAMPYPNPELRGYRAEASMISHKLADECRARAFADYERLRKDLEAEPDPGNP